MCKPTMESLRVPFRVPLAEPVSIQPRKVMDEHGVDNIASQMLAHAQFLHHWTTPNESKKGFLKLLKEEKVAFPDLIAACARLLDNANNENDRGGEGVAFIMMIQRLLVGQELEFLEAVRIVQPPANNTGEATKVALVLLGRPLNVSE